MMRSERQQGRTAAAQGAQDPVSELLAASGPHAPPSEDDILRIILRERTGAKAGRLKSARSLRP